MPCNRNSELIARAADPARLYYLVSYSNSTKTQQIARAAGVMAFLNGGRSESSNGPV